MNVAMTERVAIALFVYALIGAIVGGTLRARMSEQDAILASLTWPLAIPAMLAYAFALRRLAARQRRLDEEKEAERLLRDAGL